MASHIKILPDHLINKIAAGEVVDRPASVVKELVENAIDAAADEIIIEIEKAGNRMIRVADNGCGMQKVDAQMAFLRHATSKIADEIDLDAIRTMGFRGEALSSIASVSQVRLLTAVRSALSGALVEMEAGKLKSVSESASPQGTSVEISHLFYNTPARLKFLKSASTEMSHIMNTVSRLALAHPAIHFKLINNGKKTLDLPGSINLDERFAQLYGNELAANIMAVSGGRDGVQVRGFVGRPAYSRGDRTCQEFFVNRRAVRNSSLTHGLYAAYGDMLARDRHPVGYVFIDIDPGMVDVNVHPSKAEVRFHNQSQIHDLVRDVIRDELRKHGVPVAGTGMVPAGRSDRIQEALGEYLRLQPMRRETGEDRQPARSYGRRKSDAISESTRNAADPDVQMISAEQEVSNRSLIPVHDLIPLAQIHESFIVAQSVEGVVLVDQHAAHERILFERLQEQHGDGLQPVQNLLVPEQMELGAAQSELLTGYLPELQRAGLYVEAFGNGTFVIKAVPALLIGTDCKALLQDILDEVSAQGQSRKMDDVKNRILSVMACHPAIKVHRRLSLREMEVLIRDLFSCRMPHTCPHGRPTVLRFSIDEIKKMFKRT